MLCLLIPHKTLILSMCGHIMCGTIPATEILIVSFHCRCLSAMFHVIAWQHFTSTQRRGSVLFFPFYLELWTQLYKHSTEKVWASMKLEKRHSCVWHHTWWPTMDSCRPSKGGDGKSTIYILNFQGRGTEHNVNLKRLLLPGYLWGMKRQS